MWGKTEEVIAILCADIHLSLNPPIWRSTEPDWFEAMKRPLDELTNLQSKYDCPIICAGDVFDRWNSPAELINFAFDNLPQMYAIPGQHDLPFHKYEDIKKSAYWTLVQAGKIIDIEEENPLEIKKHQIKIYGFPWGAELVKCFGKMKDWIHIAVIHRYFWMENKKYEGAMNEDHIRHWKQILASYDIAVIGDNHQSFSLER